MRALKIFTCQAVRAVGKGDVVINGSHASEKQAEHPSRLNRRKDRMFGTHVRRVESGNLAMAGVENVSI